MGHFIIDGYSVYNWEGYVKLVYLENKKYTDINGSAVPSNWTEFIDRVICEQDKRLIISIKSSSFFYSTDSYRKLPKYCTNYGECMLCKIDILDNDKVIHPWECEIAIHKHCYTQAPFSDCDEYDCLLCGKSTSDFI